MAKSKRVARGKVFEQIKSFAFAIFLVLIIRSSIIEAFKIPSGSMIPTLMVGDYIFVNKFAYGLKVPFVDWFASEPAFIVKGEPPKRGDIIVFKYPRDESIHYIKRVIGVGGDKIRMDDKTLYINGKKLAHVKTSRPDVLTDLDGREYDKASLELYLEPNATTQVQHLTMADKSNLNFAGFDEITVPEGHLFVMGDNRDFSNDSRFWGFVPLRNVRGKALFVWFSLWLDFDKSQYSFHPGRIGTVIR